MSEFESRISHFLACEPGQHSLGSLFFISLIYKMGVTTVLTSWDCQED